MADEEKGERRELRKKAEVLLKENPLFSKTRGVEDMQVLLEEVQIYHAELEVQNQELHRTQQELIESRDRYFDVFEAAPIGYCVVGRMGIIESINRFGEELLGKPRTSIILRPFAIFLHQDDAGNYFSMLRNAEMEEGKQVAFMRLKPGDNGKIVHLRIECSPVRKEKGDTTGYRMALVDVTEQMETERELRTLSEELERRVAVRTQEVEQQAAQISQLSKELVAIEQRERRQLATEMHDYLGQLLVVAGMKAQQIEQNATDEQTRELVQELRKTVQECRDYVRTLIVELSPDILFHQGLIPALEHLAKHMERHGLKIHVLGEIPVALSPEVATLLYQSIRELMHNSLKHAETNEAWVRADYNGQKVVVQLWDEGKGFDPQTKNKLAVDTGGFGLRNIQRRLEAAGALFKLVSFPGEGTRITIEFPLEQPMTPEPKAPATPEQPAQGQRQGDIEVLIVDDHEGVREGLRMQIEGREGFRVIGEAYDGISAIEQVEQLHPDAVLMDINMPRMNGVEATRHITQRYSPIAVVGLSMRNDPLAQQEFADAGAIGFFTKDTAMTEICCKLHEVCRPTS